MRIFPNNKFGTLTKRKDNLKCDTILQRPLLHLTVMPTSMQKVLVWSVLHHLMKNSTSWEDFGSLMVEEKSLLAKMVPTKGMSWTTHHTSKHSPFMDNYLLLILSQGPSSHKDGLSSMVKANQCKLIVGKDMNSIIKSRKMRKKASKTTRGVKIVATWHHKSLCHSKDNQLLLKNSVKERPRPSRNKYLFQV